MEVKELKKKNFNAGDRVKTEETLAKMKKEHNKLVKGMFEFIDAQGGWLDFCYRWFSDDPLRTFRLVHGEICELPMGIVKHLNNTRKKIRTFNKEIDPNGRGIPSSYTTQSRVRFTPMDML
jgi:hypothetical protein